MKSLKEYSKEQLIDESLIDLFKGFWRWLFRHKKSIYDPKSDYYDEEEKIKYINKHKNDASSSDDNNGVIKIEEITKYKILEKVINDTLGKLPTTGLYKTKKYLEDNPQYKNLNNDNKFISLIFKTKELTECFGLIGITKNDKDFYNMLVIHKSEFLSLYVDRDFIDVEDIIKFLHKNNNNIVIKDKTFVKLCEKQKIKLDFDSENNVWKLK